MPAAAQARPYMPNKAATEDWNTPPEILAYVRRVLGPIDLDPCGNPGSVVDAKVQVWLPKWRPDKPGLMSLNVRLGDGLEVPWTGSVFTNPPYGPDLDRFMDKARLAGDQLGANVVMLAPSKTSRKCWQRTVPHAQAVCFIDGRVEFLLEGGARATATFSSALILWTRDVEVVERFGDELDGKLGHVMVPR